MAAVDAAAVVACSVTTPETELDNNIVWILRQISSCSCRLWSVEAAVPLAIPFYCRLSIMPPLEAYLFSLQVVMVALLPTVNSQKTSE